MSMKYLLKRNEDKWDMHQGAEGDEKEMLFNPHHIYLIMEFLAAKAHGHDTIRVEFLKDGEGETDAEM